MPVQVTMPQLSETMKDGKLLRWCVEPGDYVQAGDALAEIEADKANMELEALASGVVTELLAKPGQILAVGETVATMTEGESSEPSRGKPGGDVAKGGEQALTISPLAARMAAERGLDPASLVGTGPGGAITPEDVTTYSTLQPKAEK